MAHRERKKPRKPKTPSLTATTEEDGAFRGWTFCNWVQINGANRNVIHEWLHSLPAEDRQAINTRLTIMRKLERWPDAWASSYQGYPGILELRMNMNDTPYRPLGCFGPGPKHWQFTILVGATEVEGMIAKHLLKQATDRKRNLAMRYVCEHMYD